MRLWSLHPRYLDSAGLVALWRETLLAKAVLKGETKGYTHHPQLERFKEAGQPIVAITQYLKHIWEEANRRNYHFDKAKLDGVADEEEMVERIAVTEGQAQLEMKHLLDKLDRRDTRRAKEIRDGVSNGIEVHPLFKLVKGPMAPWERATPK